VLSYICKLTRKQDSLCNGIKAYQNRQYFNRRLGGKMKLDKENMRKMIQLILFTIIILIALWNYKMIFDAIRFVFGIIFPFLLGGGIAFVLNVPMSFFEEKLFYNRYLKDKKIANRIARPRSEEHTSELHHVSISYAVFCLKKKNIK